MWLRFAVLFIAIGASPPFSPTQAHLSPAEVYRKASRSVYVVESVNGQGSGVAVAANHVATNAHVVDGSGAGVVVRQGKRSWAARVHRSDIDSDIVLLYVPDLNAAPADLTACCRRSSRTGRASGIPCPIPRRTTRSAWQPSSCPAAHRPPSAAARGLVRPPSSRGTS